MLDYKKKVSGMGGMQHQQLHREEHSWQSGNGYHYGNESSHMQAYGPTHAPTHVPSMSRPHGYPHDHHGSGGGMWGHHGSGSHHGSGGGMWGHNGGTGRPTPAKFSHHYGGGYGAGGMTVEEVEREECRYEYHTSPAGMHVKEQYASNYANHGGGMGHGPGNYMGGMGGYPKPQAEWVSKAL